MTEQQARTAANLVLAVAAVGVAYYVLRKPPLRRLAWRLARAWATGSLPVWFATEVRRAWDAAGDRTVARTEVIP